MKFEVALEAMRNGKNVRRSTAYIRLHPVKNEFTNDNHDKVVLTPHDMLMADWEICE